MTRLFPLLALVLLAAAAAEAQTDSVVITFTADSYALSTPGDTPVTDDQALLLTHTDEGGWQSRMLSAGDVPSEVLATGTFASFRPSRSPSNLATMAALFRVLRQFETEPGVGGRMAELFEDLERNRGTAERLRGVARLASRSERLGEVLRRGAVRVTRAPLVRYSVWVEGLPDDAVPALLADLGGDDAFVRASSESSNGRSKLSLTFEFQDVGAWTAWGARTDLDGRLGAFPGVHQRTRVEVQRGARRDEIIDIVGDGEIIDMDIMDDGDVVGDGEIIDDID